MKTIKAKTKLKKKDTKFGKMKLANGQSANETSDLSQLRKPIDISLSSLKQVAELFEKGSDEIKAILNYECNIIYECKICRSLFRSLANLISHKRAYCVEKHCFVSRRRDVDSTDSTSDPELLFDPDLRKNYSNDRILRSQSQLVRIEPRKDLTSVVDMLTKKQNNVALEETSPDESSDTSPMQITSHDEKIVLEIIDSRQAAYQTVSRLENVAPGELMKNQTLELKSILNPTTGVLGPNGELIEIHSRSKNDHSTGDEEALPLDHRLLINRDTICTLCGARFATKKTLTFHMKSKHLTHRKCFPCPYCTGTFTNRWSVYRHLFRVHRKTNEQVRKIRSQIEARPCTREAPSLAKFQGTSVAQRDARKLDEAEQSLNGAGDSLESETEPANCTKCGKRFEQKAMLISHFPNCTKLPESAGRRRARKIPPQRHVGLVDTEINVVGDGNDDETEAASSEGCRTVQTSDSERPQVSSESEKCTANSAAIQKSESSEQAPPLNRKLFLILTTEKPESRLPSQTSESSATIKKPEVPSLLTKSEILLSEKKVGFSASRRKSKLIPITDETEAFLTSPEAAPATQEQKLLLDVQNPKKSPINRKSKSPAIIRRMSKSSANEKTASITTNQESAGLTSIQAKPRSIPTGRKTGSTPRNRKLQSSSKSAGKKLIPNNRKSGSFPVASDPVAMENAGLSTIVASVPAEISIRVEEVSSLSKDVWDKIGTSEEATAANFTPENVKSPVKTPPGKILSDPSTKTTTKSCKSGSDIPEVIYTSIDNSRPVELSVLSKEKKLGIQYRGIRLPTVTLEKINVTRALAKESDGEVSAIVSKEKPEIEAISRAQQNRNFQCLPCNQRFTTAANLRKHISAHVRRDRYRCKLCTDFKSLLKCDVVAHCNTVHNTKNDRNLLAELVVEEPFETRDEPEIINVAPSSTTQEPTIVPSENAIVIDEPTKSQENETTDLLTSAVEHSPESDPKPKRGRPPNVRNRTKRRRKIRRLFGKRRVLRHVSPPRLPDEASDEIPPVLETLEKSSPSRTSSRMDCDPELRKMVMEVIFGSSENGKNPKEIDHDCREFENDSQSNSTDFDQAIRCQEVIEPPHQTGEPTDPNIVSTKSPENLNHHQPKTHNSANNNSLHEHCDNYQLKNIADNHDPIVFPKKSNYVAIPVATKNPPVRESNSLSPTLKQKTPNNHLAETQQTEIGVCPQE